jgi:hypothetical protein
MKTDFEFSNVGTIVFIQPLSAEARKWSTENIIVESWQNPDNIEIEPRLFDDIAEGIKDAGLSLIQK